MPTKSLDEIQALVGETRTTVEDFEIERGKVAEFARAIRDPADIYLDEDAAREAGYDGIPAPPTFERTTEFPRYRPEGVDDHTGFDLGFDPRRIIHGEQAFEFERPLYVGDVLTGRTTLEDAYEREGQRGGTITFAEFRTDYETRDGEHVLTARATSLETGRAIADDGGDGDE